MPIRLITYPEVTLALILTAARGSVKSAEEPFGAGMPFSKRLLCFQSLEHRTLLKVTTTCTRDTLTSVSGNVDGALADLDGDQDLDLVVAPLNDQTPSRYMNEGG